MKNNILFFGELPNNIVHGISVSNEINIEILSEKFNVIKIHEESIMNEHTKFTFLKTLKFIKYIFKLVVVKFKYMNFIYLYTSLSISRGGIIKNILFSILFKLLNHRSKIILHNYRGDLESFYTKNTSNRILFNFLLLIIHRVIFLSESLIPKEFKNKNNKFCVVSNCVKEIHSNQYKNISNNNFIYISHYIKTKGIFDLLAAFKILDNKKLIYNIDLYGQFTNETDEEKIKSYSTDNIKINNFLSNDMKMNVINEASCLILPSHNEGQPQILLEAMSMGTPVIATSVGDIPTMLGFDYPLLIPANSPEKLANAIEYFLQLNSSELNKLSNILKSRYNNNYTYDIHRAMLLKTFYQYKLN